MMRAAILIATAILGWSAGHPSADIEIGQRPPLEQSVDVLVPNAPVLLDIGGTPHLVHEVHITNMRRDPVTLTRLRVSAEGSAASIADLERAALTRTLYRPGGARDGAAAAQIAPGQRIVSLLWLQLPETVRPRAVSHHLELSVSGSTRGTVIRVAGGAVTIAPAPASALGPPLAGGPWVAIYDPYLMGGHRTALYTLEGKARIPGRFASDWIRAPAAGAPPLGKQIDPATRNGFGADVLAVADARVASVMDDMPDNPPDALMPKERLPMEQGSGNYVALHLGDGRFAFYEHLRHESIRVKVGDRVRKGQVIAQLGSSGSTSIGPHLHFHVADANATLAAEGQPFVFERYEQRGAYRSITALLDGEPWLPLPAGQPRMRQRQHPSAMAVVDFSPEVVPQAAAQVRREDSRVQSDPGISLFVRHVVPNRRAGLPVLLVHGARVPGLASFDLPVPGGSLAADLAEAGYDAYVMDARGYGASTRMPEMSEPASGRQPVARTDEIARDILAVVDWIRRRHHVKPVLFGWATGGHWAGYVAAGHSDRLGGVIILNALYGGSNTHPSVGAGSALEDPEAPGRFRRDYGSYRLNDAASLLPAWDRSIPLEDKSQWRSEEVARAYVTAALESDATSASRTPASFRAPSGAMEDSFYLATGRRLWDASLIRVPVLVIRSGNDFWSRAEDAALLADHLVHAPARTITIPEATHFVHLDRPERGRTQLIDEVLTFLRMRQ